MADATATASFDLPGFGGELFHPGTEDYDEARKVFNGMIDRRPALIARCSNADDVAAAVNLAREEDLPLSVYGGGHGVTGSAVVDAGICVDLRGMKAIDVDPEARTVRAEAGLRLGRARRGHPGARPGRDRRPRLRHRPRRASRSAAAAAGSSASSASRATT